MSRGSNAVWSPVAERGSLSERIVAQVEQLLGAERLKPGERLPPEREMAQLLGVSRPSLREAIRDLQARGRLVVRHGQGVFVAQPESAQALRAALVETHHSLHELFSMREVLEVPAAQWAAQHITSDQIGGLRRTLAELDAAFDDPDVDFRTLARLDAGFHMAIADAAGNRFLAQTSDVLNEILLSGMKTTLLIPGRREISRRQHERIVAALEAGDGTAAARAARAHIRGAGEAAFARLARERAAAAAT